MLFRSLRLPFVPVGPWPGVAPGPWVVPQDALWSSASFCRRKLSSNSENISRSNFYEIENRKNRELTLGIFLIGLSDKKPKNDVIR